MLKRRFLSTSEHVVYGSSLNGGNHSILSEWRSSDSRRAIVTQVCEDGWIDGARELCTALIRNYFGFMYALGIAAQYGNLKLLSVLTYIHPSVHTGTVGHYVFNEHENLNALQWYLIKTRYYFSPQEEFRCLEWMFGNAFYRGLPKCMALIRQWVLRLFPGKPLAIHDKSSNHADCPVLGLLHKGYRKCMKLAYIWHAIPIPKR